MVRTQIYLLNFVVTTSL